MGREYLQHETSLLCHLGVPDAARAGPGVVDVALVACWYRTVDGTLARRVRLATSKRITVKIDYTKELCKLHIPCKSMKILDIKTALDRYLTHYLTPTLDRLSPVIFQLLRGQPNAHATS